MKYRHFTFIALLIGCAPAMAADIARAIHTPADGSDAFAELGITLGTGKIPLVGFNDQELEDSGDTIYSLGVGLLGRLEYKGYFVEFIQNSFSNATLGKSLWRKDNSEVELIFTSLFERTSRRDFTGLETITDRKGDFNAGLRGSYYFGDRILQFELVHDIVDSHNGSMISLQFGKQALIRNWNVHALLGVRYFSKDIVNHLFAVSATEATADIPEYSAKDGFTPSIQLGAAIPLNENWIFRGVAEYTKLPDSVSQSPLAQGDDLHTISAGVYYVFGGN